MELPYRYTVNCQIEDDYCECGIPAFGIDKLGKYVCKEHANLCLIAGLYDQPLPKMDESLKVWREAIQK